MDPFMARMLERSKVRLSQLPENIAGNARLREKQLLEAYCASLQKGGALCKEPAVNMRPVFKVPTVDIPGSKKFNDRPGKENICKTNFAASALCTAELYPRRPPRCVYNSPLLTNEANGQIFEKRYRSKFKSEPLRATPKTDRELALNIEPTNALGGNEKVQNTQPESYKNPYPSLPKINTSYDLDRLANTIMASKEGSLERGVMEKFNIAPSPKEFRGTPPMSLPNDVNICCGGVKKMVEKFSQSSLVPSPNNSPVRIPPKFEKFNRSPLASSTVNSPLKLVVPKLYNIIEPSKPEYRDIKSEEPSPEVETTEVLSADNQPEPPAHETLEERPMSISSYNVDSFLKDALGSELFFQSISSINSESIFTEDSNMTSTSSDSVPVVETSSTVPDTEPSEFLSLRVANTENYKRPVLDSSMPYETSGRKSPTYNDRVKRLTMEASVQRSLVAQTSKALYLCRTAKQFKESRELVEGERILLIASLRSQAAQEELKKCSLPPSNPASRGSLSISDIFVPLKWDVFTKLDRSLCPQWFVCVLILGETVQATEVVQLVDSQPILKFRKSMHLSDLACDFRARLQLYAFRAPHYSQKQKSKIVRACNMLRRPTRNCLGPAGSTEELMYIRNPAFTMIGCTEFTVGLIGVQQPVSCSLEQVPMVSLIKGTINFRLSAELLNTREHSGFLNVLRPAGEGHIWQRWWCHLDGKVLRCWNYPSDQEEKEPEFFIYLLECLSDKVTPAPRVLCSRPRTLMLESQRSRSPNDLDSTLLACSGNSTVVRHFLSCDSAADMTEWASAINECLEALQLWNIVPERRQERPTEKMIK